MIAMLAIAGIGWVVAGYRFREALAAVDPSTPSLRTELRNHVKAPWTVYTAAIPETLRALRAARWPVAEPHVERLRQRANRWWATFLAAIFLSYFWFGPLWFLAGLPGARQVSAAPAVPSSILWLAVAIAIAVMWWRWLWRGPFGFRGMAVRAIGVTVFWIVATVALAPTYSWLVR